METMTQSARSRQWRQAIVGLAVLIAVIVGALWETATSMVNVWYHSTTFNHGFLIPLISLWLLWNRRQALMAVTPKGSLLGLLGMFGAGLLWLTGTLGSAQVVQHFGLVLMIQAAVLAVWGWPAVRRVFFAVAYLLFAVPFGDFLTAHLQTVTAVFVVQALRIIGIPVFSDGVFISIPTGNFEVAEACAGVRFLIATVAIGTLFSYLAYRSWPRKIIFVALSFLIPVIANGFRALGIVLIAYYSNHQYAVGVDHIVYGWGFFAAVLLLLLYIGSRFSDKPVGVEETIPPVEEGERAGGGYRVLIFSAIGLVVAALGPAYAQYTVLRGEAALVTPALPDRAGRWTAMEAGANPLNWNPVFVGNSREVARSYRDDMGHVVQVYTAVYDSQLQGAELISYGNSLVGDSGNWQRASSGVTPLGPAGRAAYHRLTTLRESMNVYYWYWMDGQFVTNDIKAKLLYVRAALTGGIPSAAIVAIALPNTISDDVTREMASEFASHLMPLAAIFAQDVEEGGG